MPLEYSVLMTVYEREKTDNLKKAMDSIFNQTVKTDDFVLVCDGPLNEELDKVIEKFENRINLIRLPQRVGLWCALNTGLEHCKYQLVARMDSDDISLKDRMKYQLACFENNSELTILSGTALEFDGVTGKLSGVRRLPCELEDIIVYSKKRSSFNHPCVMYKKSEVLKCGGYSNKYAMEDYFLWIKLLQNGCEGKNLDIPLILFRTTEDTYRRRGGFRYACSVLSFHFSLLISKWSKPSDFALGALPHAMLCMAPNWVRKGVYLWLHRLKSMAELGLNPDVFMRLIQTEGEE